MSLGSNTLAALAVIGAVVVGVNASPTLAGVESPQGRPTSLGESGHVAVDVTVFDGAVPAVVNSGWRSKGYQRQLLEDAISTYGSEEEAARWVATPQTSVHVSGDAVDIGPTEATTWLADHGSTFGLCQIYDNEPWHYELRAGAAEEGCPSTYADPTQDPRMQE